MESSKLKTMNLSKFAPLVLLALAIFPMPYAYYQIMRWLLCGYSCFVVWDLHKKNKNSFQVTKGIFVLMAILYNPISPIHIARDSWLVINVISILVWLFYLLKVEEFTKRQSSSNKSHQT